MAELFRGRSDLALPPTGDGRHAIFNKDRCREVNGQIMVARWEQGYETDLECKRGR